MSSAHEERSPVELLADEFLARHKRGEKPTIKEYCDRHPDVADEIRDVFEALLMVEDLKPGSGDVTGSVGESLTVNGKRLMQVGDYRILGEIGRGGMGVVYEAEQQALGRRVALKVLPRSIAGDGSAQIRFQREAKAAARMHHTNIVPVFDVGSDGEHLYYAMQLIHGQGLDLVIQDLKRLRSHSMAETASNGKAGDRSIAASLVAGQFEKENLAVPGPSDDGATAAFEGSAPSSAMLPGQSDLSTATSNRSSYFCSVAQIGVQTAAALAYAHGRGIIHRDIKPGNLILDTTGNVWVTDFGLAKTGDGGMTHTGDILGTVRYMSPERFKGHCDVRADVYALGMTLYELLTLKAAYASGDRLKLIEMIRETEAASPRSADARIPRDLETIVMKAIDKDAKRRYQSADEMGEDLQRFVNDEPIKARRIGPVERFTRWCRHYPTVASLTAAVFLIMAAGTAVSTWQAVAATRARAELAKTNDELAAEQEKVQARFDMAAKAIETFHTGVSEDMLVKNPEFEELRTNLLKQAAGFYADLEQLLAGQTDARSRKTLAAGFFQLAELTDKIGDKKQALAVHRKALALRRELAAADDADVETRLDVARSLEKVGRLLVETGAYAEALAAHEEQRDLAAALEKASPTDLVRYELASAHDGIGSVLSRNAKWNEALAAYQQALAIQQRLVEANRDDIKFERAAARSYQGLGFVLSQTKGKPGEALAAYQRELLIREKLANAHPTRTEFQSELARCLSDIGILGRTQELGKALAIQQRLADGSPAVTEFQLGVASSHRSIGYALSLQTGKSNEALVAYQQALTILRRLANAHPTVIRFQNELASCQLNIGGLLKRTGEPEEALALYQQELATQQRLANTYPTITEFRRLQAHFHFAIGNLRRDTKKPDEALAAYQQALAIREELAKADPDGKRAQNELAGVLNNLGGLLFDTGKLDEALAVYQRVLTIREQLASQTDLAAVINNIGMVLIENGKPDEALAAYQRALAIQQPLAAANPTSITPEVFLANMHNNIGDVLVRTGKPTEALEAYQKKLDIWQRLADGNPDNPEFQSNLARSHVNIGQVLLQTGNSDEAMAACRKALAIAQSLADAHPDIADFKDIVARCHSVIGSVLFKTGKPDEALQAHLKALAINQQLVDGNPTVTSFKTLLATTHNNLGRLLARQKQFAEAVPHIDAALAIWRKLADANPKSTTYSSGLAHSHANRGSALILAGQASQAAADLRRAIELWAKFPYTDVGTRIQQARTLALLAGLGADAKSGVTTAEAATFADRSVTSLRDAFTAGWGWPNDLKEPDFDALRGREDFKKLVAELEAKAEKVPKTAPMPRGNK